VTALSFHKSNRLSLLNDQSIISELAIKKLGDASTRSAKETSTIGADYKVRGHEWSDWMTFLMRTLSFLKALFRSRLSYERSTG
jgi:hypothetical protein